MGHLERFPRQTENFDRRKRTGNQRNIYLSIYSSGQNYKNTLLVDYSFLVSLSTQDVFDCNSVSDIDFDLLFQNIRVGGSHIV